MHESHPFTLVSLIWLAVACAPSTPANEPSAPASESSETASASAGGTAKVHAEGGICGGIAGFSCREGLYCSFPPEAHCGAADQTGVCTVVPEMCTEEFAPVCGCNDKTYPNACYAAREGVSVGKKGECTPGGASAGGEPAHLIAAGGTCGTRGVPGRCAEGLYCAFRSSCGETDSGGVCTERPQICTRQYEPVCGCDGKTHGNPCTAASAGVSIRSRGECPPK
jgi:hypothetical protein